MLFTTASFWVSLAFCIQWLPATTMCTRNVSDVLLPTQLGPFAVHRSVSELIDYGRLDPYAPMPELRRLMISIYLPLDPSTKCGSARTKYMSEQVARYEGLALSRYGIPNDILLRPSLWECETFPSTPPEEGKQIPLVLFSPGLGINRHWYGAMLEAVASAGFAIVSIDHTYDADIVQFTNGTLIYGVVNDTDAEIEKALTVRTLDVSFVLDALLESDLLSACQNCDVHKVAIAGHSLGGATAAQVLYDDTRFVAGINLDGGYWGSAAQNGVKKPFLMIARTGHNQSTDMSWATFYEQSSGWKEQLTLLNSTHGTFEDLPLLAEALQIDQVVPANVLDALIGSINGHRVAQIIFAYMTSFLRFSLRGIRETLLDGPSSLYPEVVFDNFSLPVGGDTKGL